VAVNSIKGDVNFLWPCRDFGSEHSTPGHATNISAIGAPENSKTDFYEIYKEKYVAKHRRTRWASSFSIRFQPDLPRTRRFPSHPFHFIRF